jgi:tRNA A37 threonylcarbamoyladenosine dehydratase
VNTNSEVFFEKESIMRWGIRKNHYLCSRQYPSQKDHSKNLRSWQNRYKGSLVHITAIFGFMLAGLVIQNESRAFLKD